MARRYSRLLLLGFVILTGCAGPQSGGASDPSPTPPVPSMSDRSETPSSSVSPRPSEPAQPARPPLSSTPPPTPGVPTIAPQKPTDLVGSYWTSGSVSRGGTGPCYGLLTDDAVELALYTRAGIELVEGEQVRVRVRAASFRIDCGPGQLMSLLEVESD